MGCSFCPEMIDAGVRSLDDCLGSFADRQLVEAIYIAKRGLEPRRSPLDPGLFLTALVRITVG